MYQWRTTKPAVLGIYRLADLVMAHKDLAVRRAYHAKWRVRNRERIRAYHAAWRDSNRERIKGYDRRPRKTARRVAFWNRK